MTRMIDALRGWLLADTAIAALVAARVFPLRADQNSLYPMIVLQQISLTPQLYTHGELGLVTTRVQVGCWAKTYSEAHNLANKVRLRVSGYTGVMGGPNNGDPAITVQDCELDNVYDQDDDTPGQDDRRLCGVITDYLIWHAQTVPDFTQEEE